MAASKDLSHSVLHGSEEVVDRPCSICKTRDNRVVESVIYCVDCDSNMCKACTTWHASFPTMTSHQVLDVYKAPGTRAQKAPLPSQRCEEHHGKLIDKFCPEHNEVACESCVSLRHSNCTHLKYIPTFAKGIRGGNSLQNIQATTFKLMKELKFKKSSQRDTLQQLNTAETQSQQVLKHQTTRLHAYIDNLSKIDSAKITSKFQKEKDEVQKVTSVVDDQIESTEKISKMIHEFRGDNESELFVYIKQGEKNAKEAKHALQTLVKSKTSISTYKPNNDAEKTLKCVNSLGGFTEPISAKLNEEVNVRTARDVSLVDSAGICILPDASIILTDYSNRNLKRLDNSYNVISCIDLSAEPFGVCYTNSSNEIAVTMYLNKEIQFVRIGAALKKTRSFDVGDICKGIAYNNDELFVCCGDPQNITGGSVRVYSLTGALVRIIKKDETGTPMFSVTACVTLSSCGNKLFITDCNKGIVSVDMVGKHLATFTDTELGQGYGICTLENGDLLVCDYVSNNILHVSNDGKKCGVILKEKDGLVKPQAVCFDCVHSRLMVSTMECDILRLYDIHMY